MSFISLTFMCLKEIWSIRLVESRASKHPPAIEINHYKRVKVTLLKKWLVLTWGTKPKSKKIWKQAAKNVSLWVMTKKSVIHDYLSFLLIATSKVLKNILALEYFENIFSEVIISRTVWEYCNSRSFQFKIVYRREFNFCQESVWLQGFLLLH